MANNDTSQALPLKIEGPAAEMLKSLAVGNGVGAFACLSNQKEGAISLLTPIDIQVLAMTKSSAPSASSYLQFKMTPLNALIFLGAEYELLKKAFDLASQELMWHEPKWMNSVREGVGIVSAFLTDPDALLHSALSGGLKQTHDPKWPSKSKGEFINAAITQMIKGPIELRVEIKGGRVTAVNESAELAFFQMIFEKEQTHYKIRPFGKRSQFEASEAIARLTYLQEADDIDWTLLILGGDLSLKALNAALKSVKSDEVAQRAAVACIQNGYEEGLRLLLDHQGYKLDLVPLQMEAKLSRSASLTESLKQPIHAYAIKAQQFEWVEQELDALIKQNSESERGSDSLGWLNQPAGFSTSLTPLSAVISELKKSSQKEKSKAWPLFQKMMSTGINPNVLTQSSYEQFKEPIPLILEALMDGDQLIIEALFKKGVTVASLNDSVGYEGQKTPPLGVACLRGDVLAVQYLLHHGADPRLLPGSILKDLSDARPSIRSMLGPLPWLTRMSKQVRYKANDWFKKDQGKHLAQKKPVIIIDPDPIDREVGTGGLRKTPMPGDLNESTVSEAKPSLADRLKVQSYEERANALHAALIKLDLPSPLPEKIGLAMASRAILQPHGEYPALEHDAHDLERLWEQNIPRFIKSFKAIPMAHRNQPGLDGHKTPIDKMNDMWDVALGNMEQMRARTIRHLLLNLEQEAAVIADGAESPLTPLNHFESLIRKAEAVSQKDPAQHVTHRQSPK